VNEAEINATLAAVATQRNSALDQLAIMAGKVTSQEKSIGRMMKEVTYHIEENEKLKATIVSNERAISRYKKLKNVEETEPD